MTPHRPTTPIQSDLDRAVKAARDATGNPAQISRLRQAFHALPPTDPGALNLAPTARLHNASAVAKLCVLGIVSGIACGFAWRMVPNTQPATAPPVPSVSSAPVPLPTPKLNTNIEPTPLPVEEAQTLPAVPKRKARIRPPRRRARAPRAIAPPHTELELLTRAQRDLTRAPKQALNALRSHALHYPQGTYAQERDRLEIDALDTLGRSDRARTRARAFMRRYPKSAHNLRLQEYFE